MNAAQLALDGLARYGEYASTWFEGRTYTNVEQLDSAGRLGRALSNHGVRPGDRVVIMMPTCLEIPAAFQAIWRIGAVIVPLMPHLVAAEVAYIVEHSGAEVVLTSPELAALAVEATRGIDGFRQVLVFGEPEAADAVNIRPEVEAAPSLESLSARADADLGALVYTSGTTGHPKGVMLSHANLTSNAQAVAELFNVAPRARMMMVLPMSHVYGILVMNVSWLMGIESAMLRRFDAEEALRTIQGFRVERVSLVPTMLIHMLRCPRRERYDVSSLRYVTAGSAPLSEEVRLEFQQVFGCRVADGYGLSESTCAVTSYRDDEAVVPGSAGRPLAGMDVCIMDEDLRQLPPGATGEICIRGSCVMQGYWRDPKATARTVIDGWLHSGDIGHVDQRGYVFVTDRKKDLIIKGAENISPRQIEEAIYGHPSVSECAVFGVPDETYQEEIAAAVVLKPGQAASAEDIRRQALQSVTRFKQPRFVRFLQELPKNSNGKVLKRALRDEWIREM